MAENTKEMKLKAEGMTCAGCAEDMEIILRNTAGILQAEVSYADEIITLRYDPDVITGEEVFSAASKLGFKTTIISGS